MIVVLAFDSAASRQTTPGKLAVRLAQAIFNAGQAGGRKTKGSGQPAGALKAM
jgi:hypothetical protein